MSSGRHRDSDAAYRALVLAGGLGTRLRPVTDHTPKCLVPIGGRPLIDYWFDLLADAGIRDVLLNTHHLADLVRLHIARLNETTGFRIRETFEPELLGSAGTIHANRDWADEADHCVIIYADNLSNVDLTGLVDFHESHEDPFTMLLFRTPDPPSCGIATIDDTGRVTSFVEKPKTPESDLANAGVYVVSAAAYREIADMDAFDLGFDVLPRFVGRMRGWVHDGYHLDIGTQAALQRAGHDVTAVFGPGTSPDGPSPECGEKGSRR
ncbi:MAG: nucleotidyltransferase family protein [Deltaproteobacteria bacterium]|nr:nucleotidyltransferase family protein [Deltaproteobacteria bacterium]